MDQVSLSYILPGQFYPLKSVQIETRNTQYTSQERLSFHRKNPVKLLKSSVTKNEKKNVKSLEQTVNTKIVPHTLNSLLDRSDPLQ